MIVVGGYCGAAINERRCLEVATAISIVEVGENEAGQRRCLENLPTQNGTLGRCRIRDEETGSIRVNLSVQ